jgi:hypothetical protein
LGEWSGRPSHISGWDRGTRTLHGRKRATCMHAPPHAWHHPLLWCAVRELPLSHRRCIPEPHSSPQATNMHVDLTMVAWYKLDPPLQLLRLFPLPFCCDCLKSIKITVVLWNTRKIL